MTNIDPVHRLSAKEALVRLGMVICSMTPESLLIEPVITEECVAGRRRDSEQVQKCVSLTLESGPKTPNVIKL